MSRLYTLLRSRRLALLLLMGVTIYSFAGTLVPQEHFATASMLREWDAQNPGFARVADALGLYNAFATPLFLVLAGLLTMSTAACAWERSRMSITQFRSWSRTDAQAIDRLKASPSFSVPVDIGTCSGDVCDAVAQGLESLGMRVRRGPRIVSGTQRVWGLAGSPVFHWALAGLFLFAWAGHLTKWEAKIGLPMGQSIPDRSESYVLPRSGPLSAAVGSGGTWLASGFDPELIKDGVSRGFTADVELRGPTGRAIATGQVYPNSPLRGGVLLAHRDGWGLSSVLVLENEQGVEVGRRYDYFDFEDLDKSGRIRVDLAVPPELGVTSLEAALPLDESPDAPGAYTGDLPDRPRLEFTFSTVSGDTSGPVTLSAGEVLALPESDLSLRVVDVNRYLRLLVVHDWTVPFVYAFLVLSCIGAAVALSMPPRHVLVIVMPRDDDGLCQVNVRVRSRKLDPAFPARVRSTLERALGVPSK